MLTMRHRTVCVEMADGIIAEREAAAQAVDAGADVVTDMGDEAAPSTLASSTAVPASETSLPGETERMAEHLAADGQAKGVAELRVVVEGDEAVASGSVTGSASAEEDGEGEDTPTSPRDEAAF
jgi:hypothetical protein